MIRVQPLTVKVLARRHEGAVWTLHQTVGRLPVKALPKLQQQQHTATTILAAAPTPAARQLTRQRIEALLHRC